jgi:hypothetical protein
MTGEFNGLIILGVLWFILSRMTSRGRSSTRRPETFSQIPPQPRQLPGRPDATQQEGIRLETLLRDLQRSMEQAASTTRPGDPRPTQTRSVRLERLPTGSEARSLEADVEPEARRLVDLDDEAAEVEARRIQAAEARNLPRGKDQPVALEQIKPEPAEHTASRVYSARQLRDAIIWREILDPPVSER